MREERTSGYYALRSFVRFIFWGTIIAIFMWVVMTSIAVLAFDDTTNGCNITLERDFTWNVREFAQLNPTKTLADCRHYESVILKEDGRWEWYDPYIGS